MHPPAEACRRLYELHPQLRLAWAGRPKELPEEMDPGSFCLIQLYHVRDVGNLDDTENTFREVWHVTTRQDDMGDSYRTRIDRGPIFNRWGGTSLDYDPLQRVPIFVATLDQDYCYGDGTPIHERDVYSGKFLEAVKRWITPIKDRLREDRARRYGEFKDQSDGVVDNMVEELMWMQNNVDNTSDHTVTIQEQVEAEAEVERNQYRRNEALRKSFLLPGDK